MKKLLSIAMASLAVAALADPPANTASPTIGVTAITTSLKNTIISVPFTALSGGGNISVTDMVATNNFVANDWIYVFNGETYSAWTLDPASGWVAATSASTSGDIVDAVANDANKYVAAPGAIWIVLSAVPTSPKTFYIYGNFDTRPVSQTLSGVGSYLVANPKQADATLTVTGAAKKDAIVIPTNEGQDRYTYSQLRGQPDSIGWYKNGEKVSSFTIPAGQGFWYVRNTSSDVVLGWE